MKKVLLLICSFLFLVLAGFLIFEVVIPILTPANAQLSVTSTKNAQLYLDGKLIGNTPFYVKKLKIGDHELAVKGLDESFSWQEVVTLTSQTLTVVEIDPAKTSLFTAADILNFKTGETGLVLISQPNQATVTVDEKPFGTAPLNKGLSNGIHTLKISKAGYLSRLITINIEPGFTLNARVFLAANPFAKINKIDSTPKLNLFVILNPNLNLSNSYSSWAQAVVENQTNFSETVAKFDFLIDPNGNTYSPDQKNWEEKIRTKATANIGYLAKNGQESLTKEAQAQWEKVKTSFD